MVGIIDYNMGNSGSIMNMIKKLGQKSIITNSYKEIKECQFLILPGVGSFDIGIKNLKKYNLFNLIIDIANEGKIPIMGICLGMQLLCKSSDEGTEKGLGLIDAEVLRFPDSEKLKIPHMGWNYIQKIKKNNVFNNLEDLSRFYFVHSYYVKCNKKNNILFKTNYGIEFDSAFISKNIIGFQFHPEKSHKYGMNLFNCFFQLNNSNV